MPAERFEHEVVGGDQPALVDHLAHQRPFSRILEDLATLQTVDEGKRQFAGDDDLPQRPRRHPGQELHAPGSTGPVAARVPRDDLTGSEALPQVRILRPRRRRLQQKQGQQGREGDACIHQAISIMAR